MKRFHKTQVLRMTNGKKAYKIVKENNKHVLVRQMSKFKKRVVRVQKHRVNLWSGECEDSSETSSVHLAD